MGRRGENIRKRRDGRWEARVICSYAPDGKAKYRSFYGKSYQEAKEKRNAWIAGSRRHEAEENEKYLNQLKITFEQVMREWLAAQKDSVKESTYAHYTGLLEKHLLPALGAYYFSTLTSDAIDIYLKEELCTGRLDGTGGLSPKSVADIRSVLLLGLEYAKQKGYPCEVNRKLFYPRNRQSHIRIMTRDEQLQLENVLFQNPEPLELGILTALYGGLRIGEVCALQWGDFHFENGTICISKTLLRIQNVTSDNSQKTKILIDCPKTESSNRIVPMPSAILEFLEPYRMEPDFYLLTGARKWMEPRMCLEKYKKVLQKAGLESFTFHTLRHTFATRCVESGFDIKSLSEILGHANVNTTLQRYVHPSMDQKKAQMELLPVSIRGQKQGQKNL